VAEGDKVAGERVVPRLVHAHSQLQCLGVKGEVLELKGLSACGLDLISYEDDALLGVYEIPLPLLIQLFNDALHAVAHVLGSAVGRNEAFAFFRREFLEGFELFVSNKDPPKPWPVCMLGVGAGGSCCGIVPWTVLGPAVHQARMDCT